MQLKALRDWLGWVPALRKFLLSRAISGSRIVEDVVGESWQLLSSQRNVLFNEMEYHLPVNTGLDAMEEVRHYIERHRRDIFFRLKRAAPKPTRAGCRRFKAKTAFRLRCIAITKTRMSFYFPMLSRFSIKPVGDRIGASSTA